MKAGSEEWGMEWGTEVKTFYSPSYTQLHNFFNAPSVCFDSVCNGLRKIFILVKHVLLIFHNNSMRSKMLGS